MAEKRGHGGTCYKGFTVTLLQPHLAAAAAGCAAISGTTWGYRMCPANAPMAVSFVFFFNLEMTLATIQKIPQNIKCDLLSCKREFIAGLFLQLQDNQVAKVV